MDAPGARRFRPVIYARVVVKVPGAGTAELCAREGASVVKAHQRKAPAAVDAAMRARAAERSQGPSEDASRWFGEAREPESRDGRRGRGEKDG